MKITKDEIARNLLTPDWITAFVQTYLEPSLQPIEQQYNYERIGLHSVPTIDQIDYFPDRGIVLWTCDECTSGKSTEMVLFASGDLSIISRSYESGREPGWDWEHETTWRLRRIEKQRRISKADLEKYGLRIARELFWRAVEQELVSRPKE